MPNSKKVFVRKDKSELTDKERQKREQKLQDEKSKADQEAYEEKVEGLLKSCKKFDKYLHETFNDSDRWHLKFKEIFKDYLESKKLFSRTRSVLKDIYKQFKYYTQKKYPVIAREYKGHYVYPYEAGYFEELKFIPKKADKKGYIKRSAIDDPKVASYFNETLEQSLVDAYRRQPLKIGAEYYGYEKANVQGYGGKGSNIYVDRVQTTKGEKERIYIVGKHAVSDPFINAKKVTISPSVDVIPDCAFKNFKKMEELVILRGVKKIGFEAFLGCENLKSVILPSGLQDIDCSAFRGCINLKSLVIPRGVKWIRESAFWGCRNLESVVFESSPFVGQSAFGGCNKLKEITCLNGVPSFCCGRYNFLEIGGRNVITMKFRNEPDKYMAMGKYGDQFKYELI